MRDSATRVVPSGTPNSSTESHHELPSQHGWVRTEERAGDDRPSRERPVRACRGGVTRLRHLSEKCNTEAIATTKLPDASLLPDVLPTERLRQSGMPVPAIRASLRHISNARSAVTVVACLLPDVRRRRHGDVIGAVVGLRVRVPLDRSRALPAQHPRPRGRASAALHLAVAEQRRRQVAARVPDVSGVHGVPTRALRGPQGRDGSRGARPRPLPATRSRPTRCGASSTRDLFFISGYRTWPDSAGAVPSEGPRGAVHRRSAGGAVRHLHRRRTVGGCTRSFGSRRG